jgi:molybdopterin synthase catalytic subunit
MVKITSNVINVEAVINGVRNESSGGIIAYVGLIRNTSQHGKPVVSVEYSDADGNAEAKLQSIADDIKDKWPINDIAFVHRIGKLKVGDNNLVVAVSAAHRQEGFNACKYAIDQFKVKLPTRKRETYLDGTCYESE